MDTRKLSLAVACLMAVGSLMAQTSSQNVSVPERAIVLTGGQNGINSQVMTVLYDTSETHFQDPQPPRFLLIDREGRTVFGVGGYVEGVAQYDFDGALDNYGLDTYDIPVPGKPDLRNRLGADMSRSNIFMMLVTHTRWGVLSAYAKGNFSGDGYGFKLKQAYVKLHNVLGGLTRTTFQDVLSGVPTIDYQGPSGAISAKNIQLRYSYSFNKNLSMAVAAEMPKPAFTDKPGINEEIPQRMPDIPAYIQYAWDGGRSHVRASALFRELSYRNLVSGENKFATGWAVQLSGAVRCDKYATIFYQGAYGKGYGQYINDLGGNGFDLVYSGADGRMEAPGALALVGGVRFNINPRVFVSGSYSLCRLHDQEQMGPEAYRRANYAVANCFYTPMPELKLGIEYVHGERTNMSGMSNTANRIEAMIQYNF